MAPQCSLLHNDRSDRPTQYMGLVTFHVGYPGFDGLGGPQGRDLAKCTLRPPLVRGLSIERSRKTFCNHLTDLRMPKLSQPAALIQQLQLWSDSDLRELSAMIHGLLESRSDRPTPADATREDGTALGSKGGRGHIELKLIPDAKTGKTYGPYRYLRYWGVTKTGKKGLKSVYLGKMNLNAENSSE